MNDKPEDLKVIILSTHKGIMVVAHDEKYEFSQVYERIDDVDATVTEVKRLAFGEIRKKYQ